VGSRAWATGARNDVDERKERRVGRVTCDMAMSIDGFVAGPNQSLDNPLGEGIGDQLHAWLWERAPGDVEVIDQITAAGAFVMGRNLFGPVRGVCDQDW